MAAFHTSSEQTVGYMPMPAAFPRREVFLRGRPRHRKYDDFWIRHPPMDPGHRAKIFAPFDALRGFDFCIMAKEVRYTERAELSDFQKEQLDRQLHMLQSLTYNGRAARRNRPFAEITYFEPCTDTENFAYGKGGRYLTVSGTVSRVDTLTERTITVDNRKISLDTISQIRIL